MPSLDVKLNRLASRQHWLATRSQALELGLTPCQVKLRLQSGALTTLHKGIYVVGAAPRTFEQRVLGACWATDGVASHRTAAALWKLRRFEPGPIEITVRNRRRRELTGMRCHSTDRFDKGDITRLGVIPITSVARTLLDLGAVAPDRVAGAVEDALFRGLVSPDALHRLLDRLGGNGRRATAVLRRVLDERQSEPTESVLEDSFGALLDRHHVEQPVRQYRVKLSDGREVRLDFADPEIKLDIELDSRRWHSTLTDVARDRRRDRLLVARGWTILRYSPDDLKRRGAEVVDEVTHVRVALRSRAG